MKRRGRVVCGERGDPCPHSCDPESRCPGPFFYLSGDCGNYRLHGSAVTCPVCGFRGAVDRSNYPDHGEGEQA